MPTVKEIVLKHHLKERGACNVKIRLTHKRKSIYLDTSYYVTAKQLKSDLSIKDTFILKQVINGVEEYRLKLNELGSRCDFFDVKQLAEALLSKEVKPNEINIISFGRERINELKELKRNSSAANMTTVVNSLVDYFHRDFVPVTAITAKMLERYEIYLRKPRKLERVDQFNKLVTTESHGLTDNGIYCHFRDLRILFNNIKDHYNDEELGITVIKHYPFKKYKIRRYKPRRKKKLTIEQVKKVRDLTVSPNSRMELARDLFMLSLYLCGMNAVDLYKFEKQERTPKRIEYYRSKTTSRRTDEAFISIKLVNEAKNLFIKYVGAISNRYSNHLNLDHALSIGMREVGKKLAIPNLEFYDARHFFADVARNKCRFSKDDIGLALNHIDDDTNVTDLYVSKDWSIIDEIQQAVINLLK
ncbi:MAG: phage integrase SAM-like domain-containing protein [Mucilaginibacter sp.]